MPEISNFIKMLQSEDHNKRYEACEKLRVWDSALPQEAIDALLIAASDTVPDVADAAERALALHTSNTYNSSRKNPDASSASKINAGVVGAIIVMIVIFGCMASIPSDPSPESYEIRGNLMMAAAVFGLAMVVPVILLISFVVLVKLEKKTRVSADNQEKTPGVIHAITSIIYIGIVVFNIRLIFWDLVVNGGGLLIALFWTIGSIVISRILINKNYILIAYLVLLSAPVVAWLVLSLVI